MSCFLQCVGVLFFCALAGAAGNGGQKRTTGKYVLHVVADDLGYDDVGWRNPQVYTPTLDGLVKDGVEIPEFNTYMMCAPARGSLMSGRYPMRLGVYTENLAEWDLDKAVLLPAALKAGKGDLRWATHALGKVHGARPAPARVAVGRNLTLADPSAFGVYDTEVLSARAVRIVAEHPLDQGLYLYLAYHAVHDPNEAPRAAVQRYQHVRWDGRKVSNAMLTELDAGVQNITSLMRKRGMWNDTLVIFHTEGTPAYDAVITSRCTEVKVTVPGRPTVSTWLELSGWSSCWSGGTLLSWNPSRGGCIGPADDVAHVYAPQSSQRDHACTPAVAALMAAQGDSCTEEGFHIHCDRSGRSNSLRFGCRLGEQAAGITANSATDRSPARADKMGVIMGGVTGGVFVLLSPHHRR
eukprot:g113.t1